MQGSIYTTLKIYIDTAAPHRNVDRRPALQPECSSRYVSADNHTGHKTHLRIQRNLPRGAIRRGVSRVRHDRPRARALEGWLRRRGAAPVGEASPVRERAANRAASDPPVEELGGRAEVQRADGAGAEAAGAAAPRSGEAQPEKIVVDTTGATASTFMSKLKRGELGRTFLLEWMRFVISQNRESSIILARK